MRVVLKNRRDLWARALSSTRVLSAVLFTGLTAAACDSDNGPTNTDILSSITVTPTDQTIAISGTQQFTASGRDSFGNLISITPAWSVVGGGGTIHATTGLFTAGTTPGTYSGTVRAAAGGMIGSATISVGEGALSTISITPGPVTLGAGLTQQFTAVGRDSGGNVVSFSPAWTVVAGGGTINPATGLFTAGPTSGTYNNTIRAGSGAVAGLTTVTVTSAP